MPEDFPFALRQGIYRCSGDGQTKHFKQGEVLYPCYCSRGEWLCTVADNPEARLDTVYVNSIMESTDTDEVPEVGNKLNVFGQTIRNSQEGLYEITGVTSASGPYGKKLMIHIRRIGPRDPTLRVHILSLCGC